MKLTNILLLYGTRLRARTGQEVLALVGIAVGVSLLFAALVANASLTSSFDRALQGVVGDARWQLATRGPSMDENVTDEVRAIPGVAAAAPVLERRAEVLGPDGRTSVVMIGVTEAFARVNGRQTQRLSASYLAGQQAIAVPAKIGRQLGLSLGQSVNLLIDGRRVQARLGALLQRDQIGDLADTPLALAPLAYGQRLAGAPGAVTRVFVVPRPGRDEDVERALKRVAGTRFSVHEAGFETNLFRQASQPTSQSTAMFSVFSALVGFLFAFSAVLLTVPDRRRLIADLNLEGYTPRVITKVILVDALVLGVFGSALGILIGDQVSRRLFSDTPGFLQLAFTFGAQRIVTPSAVAVAALGGILASCAAVFGPTATAISGLRQRREDARGSSARRMSQRLDWSTAGGLVCFVTGTAIVVAAPNSAAVGILGLVILTIAMLLLLPSILRLVVAGLMRGTRSLRTVVPFLASVDLRDRTSLVRALAVAATGAVAVFGSVALQGAHADLQRGLDRTTRDQVSVGDLWVMAPGTANLLATIPFSPSLMPLHSVPGVGVIRDFRGGFLDIGDRRVWVVGAPRTARYPLPRHQIVNGSERRATERIRSGGWVVLSAGVANELGVDVGERFTLPSPHPIPLRVAAVSTNMGWPPGSILLNADDYAAAWGSNDVSALVATLAPGTSAKDGQKALTRLLGPRSGLVINTAADRERELMRGSRQGLKRLTQIAALVLVAAMIAMAAAMAGLIWQRRSFYAAVRIEGYGTRTIWRALLLESALLIGVGCAVGGAFGLLGQRLLSVALTNVTGFPVSYSLAATPAMLSCLAVVTVSVTIVAGFGYYTARVSARSGAQE